MGSGLKDQKIFTKNRLLFSEGVLLFSYQEREIMKIIEECMCEICQAERKLAEMTKQEIFA